VRTIEAKLALLMAAGIAMLAADGSASAIPTFESLSLYYNRPVAKECKVHYRVAGAPSWREGYPLVYDERERQYRGSLVGLTSNTLYEIRLEADGQKV
jgi:hypothetical protein